MLSQPKFTTQLCLSLCRSNQSKERMMNQLPNKGIPVPADYVEMMRHYIPKLPMPAIKMAWLHNATPKEVIESMVRK